jgi:hypothetical protein
MERVLHPHGDALACHGGDGGRINDLGAGIAQPLRLGISHLGNQYGIGIAPRVAVVESIHIGPDLKAVGIEVEKKNITIPEDIKALGEYEGAVKCYKAVKAALKFVVEAEA